MNRIIKKENIENIKYKLNKGSNITRSENFMYENQFGTLNKNFGYFLSHDELMEFSKCSTDVIYFIEKYCEIKLHQFQINWLNNKDSRFQLYLLSRQIGFTRIYACLSMWNIINGKNTYYISEKMMSSSEFLDICWKIYLKLPYFLKPNIISKNRKILNFSTGIISTFLENKIKDNSEIHLAEYAFHKKHLLLDIIPILNSDTKIIISSVPNGYNHFYKLYTDSISGENLFNCIKTYWWEVPNRDEKWKQETIKNIGGLKYFLQEYELCFVSK
jgi:hypothetical protein